MNQRNVLSSYDYSTHVAECADLILTAHVLAVAVLRQHKVRLAKVAKFIQIVISDVADCAI